jgi:hypothetical protein
MRTPAKWVVLAVLAPGVALAHKDLAGDVYPGVRVVDGMFVVRFTSSIERNDFETVLTPSGEVTVARRAAHGPHREPPLSFEAHSSENAYVVELGPPRTTNALRGYSVRHTGPSGVANTFDLHWSDDIDRFVSDAQAREDTLFLLTFAPQDGQLRLDRFDPQGTQAGSISLGRSAYVYFFPITSRIAVYRNGYLVAWVAQPEEDGRAALNLSWWNPITGESTTIVVEPRIYWNTSVSLGVIGDDILVAYHGPPKARYHGPPSRGAVINTVHIRGLPESQ